MDHKKILAYTKNKVKNLFKDYPIDAHGIDHIQHVRDWAVKLANAEGANIFVCEMSAWLHDIGRTRESERNATVNTHQELSYQMCKEWFNDPIFNEISNKKKIMILYSVRYHWNNAANKYLEAGILRDADKLDLFGVRGVKRAKEYWNNDQIKMEGAARIALSDSLFFYTATAKDIVKEKRMIEPVIKFYLKLLKKRIEPVTLAK